MPKEPPAQGLYYVVQDRPGPEGSRRRFVGLVLVPQIDRDGRYVVGRSNTERKKIAGTTAPLREYLRQHGYSLWMHAPDVDERRPSLIHPNSILGSE